MKHSACIFVLSVVMIFCFVGLTGQNSKPGSGSATAFGDIYRTTLQTTKSAYMDTSFVVLKPAVLHLLPIYDTRTYDKISIDVKGLSKKAKADLSAKGYQVMMDEKASECIKCKQSEIELNSPGWIKQLGPEDVKYVLLLNVVRFNDINVDIQAVIVGYLFDKQAGTLLWCSAGSFPTECNDLAKTLDPSTGKIKAFISKKDKRYREHKMPEANTPADVMNAMDMGLSKTEEMVGMYLSETNEGLGREGTSIGMIMNKTMLFMAANNLFWSVPKFVNK